MSYNITKGSYDKARAFMQSKFGHTDGEQPAAGAGSHRSGGFEQFGSTPIGAGYDRASGTPKLARGMDEHVNVGNPSNDGNIANYYSRQMDIKDVGDNRAHVNGGRDRAMQVSRDTGGVHPMEHAGKMGKGRW